jgi:hypothetical protein
MRRRLADGAAMTDRGQTNRGEAGMDEFAEMRARRAALRAQKPMLKRYLTVLALIFAVIIALGMWLKPPVEKMEEAVTQALTDYVQSKTAAGGVAPVVTQQESRDWVILVSHVAKVGDETFSCVGGFKITFCQSPDVE